MVAAVVGVFPRTVMVVLASSVLVLVSLKDAFSQTGTQVKGEPYHTRTIRVEGNPSALLTHSPT